MARHATIERVVLWHREDAPGLEYCALSRGEASWHLEGTVLLTIEGQPAQVTYAVACDAGWTTEQVQVTVRSPGGDHQLWLATDADRRWWRRDAAHATPHELPAVRGLADVDLGFTPATNTLPVRRLGVGVGEHVDVTAAWVRFPELTMAPLPQRYLRLGEHQYRYEARESGFMADLELDELGLVVRYGTSWTRVAVSAAARP